MEPKVVIYLKRVVKTISMALLWLILNARIGVVNGYAFVENKIKLGNVLYYILFIASLAFLLYYFYTLWKNDLHFEEEDDTRKDDLESIS